LINKIIYFNNDKIGNKMSLLKDSYLTTIKSKFSINRYRFISIFLFNNLNY